MTPHVPIKIAGIFLSDLVNLTAMVRLDGKLLAEPESMSGAMRVEEMGLRFDYLFVPGPAICRHILYGRRWSFWFDLGGAVFKSTDGSPTLVQWMTTEYRRVFDWNFEGDEMDFYSDLTMARMLEFI